MSATPRIVGNLPTQEQYNSLISQAESWLSQNPIEKAVNLSQSQKSAIISALSQRVSLAQRQGINSQKAMLDHKYGWSVLFPEVVFDHYGGVI